MGIGVYLRWRIDIRRQNGRPRELFGHANTLRCIFLVASLVTDHNPLVHSYSNARSKPTPWLERWSLKLQPYDFQIVY